MPRVFVYGALMTHPRILERGERACVRDHAVRFTARGPRFLEPAFAALEPSPGEIAWGVAAALDEEGWRRMRKRELSYLEGCVMAETSREHVECIALFIRPRMRCPERSPSARYASLLPRGAEQHGLPHEVIERYKTLAETGSRFTLMLPRGILRR